MSAARPSNLACCESKNRQRRVTQIFHWFVHDAHASWVTALAQSPSLLVLPDRLCRRFHGILCRRLLHRPRHLPSDHPGRRDRRQPYRPVSGLAGAVLGSILGDWISWWIGFHYHHQIVHFWLFRRFEEQIEKALHLFTTGAPGRSSSAVSWARFAPPCRWWRACPNWNSGPFMIANTASAILWAFALLTPVGAAVRHLMR